MSKSDGIDGMGQPRSRVEGAIMNLRTLVHAKYDGHCAYCGKIIRVSEMQVDHIVPKNQGGTNDIGNLNPACRRCNHYKRGGNPEYLRWLLRGLLDRLDKIYIYKVAKDYGMISETPFDRKFYFEKLNNMPAETAEIGEENK